MVTPPNHELYAQFIPHILGDLAERRTDSGAYLQRGQRRWIMVNGERRRVFVHGDHVCYQHEQFHDSDCEFRLAMALAAAELIEQERLGGRRGPNTKACLQVAQAVLTSPCERLKRRFPRSVYQAQRQGSPSAPHITTELPVLDLAETIRRQVNRYRKHHSDWQRDFDFEVARFCGRHFRDPSWYREVEEGYVRWLQDFEKRQEFEWFEAMKIVGMARFYQYQHRFDESAAVYRKAILSARKALMVDEYRQVILLWLRISIKASLRKTRTLPDPDLWRRREGSTGRRLTFAATRLP